MICKYCGGEIKNKWGKLFCSRGCSNKSRIVAIYFKTKCGNCNKEIKKHIRFNKFSINFCNMNCYNEYKIKHNIFKGLQRKSGWKHTEEVKENISKNMKGKQNCLGNKQTLEHRLNISKGHKGKWPPKCLDKNKCLNGYSLEFNKQTKERVRVRDNFRCRLCGIPELELNQRLHIHHIDFDKSNCKIDNLISLCNSCHCKTRFRVKKYIKKFKEIQV